MELKALTWNTQWATPASKRTPDILRRVEGHTPDIACLTEVNDGLLSRDRHSISAGLDYGYALKAGRRKVLLWSREPWEQVDDVGRVDLPPGRFVSGVTQTPLGMLTVVGICIPWFGCRTEAHRGVERKARWEDHEDYLDGLTGILGQLPAERLIVMGDFNQVIGPGARAPGNLRTQLMEASPPGMTIVTADIAFQGRKSIDHIVLSKDLFSVELHAISNDQEGVRLSDHFGVAAAITA